MLRSILPLALCLLLLSGCAVPASPAPSPTPKSIDIPTPLPTAEPTTTPSPRPTLPPTPSPTPYSEPPHRTLPLYALELSFERETDTLTGRMWLEYIHLGEVPLYALYFRLHPNTRAEGAMTINTVALNGRKAYYETEAPDLLRLPLAIELQSGGSCGVYMEFTVRFSMDYGVAWHRYDMECVTPVVAGYDGGWNTGAAYLEDGYSQEAEFRAILYGMEGYSMESTLTQEAPGYLVSDGAEYLTMTLHYT